MPKGKTITIQHTKHSLYNTTVFKKSVDNQAQHIISQNLQQAFGNSCKMTVRRDAEEFVVCEVYREKLAFHF